MNLLRVFGIGSGGILAKDCHVPGTVTKVSRCWWLTIKTKPARLYANSENTVNPYMITFEYRIDSIPYTGTLYIPIRCRVPQAGGTICVYYDPEKPKNYACYSFGPGTVKINW